MSGFNPGFLWSLINRPERHYRLFNIPKGQNVRQIEAPRVALKLIQKWLSVHLEQKWRAHEAVHGFVKGRSHLSAAMVHLRAVWVASVDIENFFPSTTRGSVVDALMKIGYKTENSLFILSKLLCFQGRLSQGAPTSPVISNIVLDDIDRQVMEIARRVGARYTRYADDIVLPGDGELPDHILGEVEQCFLGTPWRLSARKKHVARLPHRLKVHGLLVHGDTLRLTKGYRNRIRAFSHLIEHNAVKIDDINKLKGHIIYSNQVDKFSSSKIRDS